MLDFGLCADVDLKSRKAMTKALTNLLYRDFDALVEKDAKELGFLPEDFDTEPLKPVLIKVLTGGLLESGSNMEQRKRKFMEISNELNEIFFQYPFQVPAFFALVTRGLEGRRSCTCSLACRAARPGRVAGGTSTSSTCDCLLYTSPSPRD